MPVERVKAVWKDGNLIFTPDSGFYVGVDSDLVNLSTAQTPANASDTGNAGDICWDADYVYVCVAANTWKRAGLSTWA